MKRDRPVPVCHLLWRRFRWDVEGSDFVHTESLGYRNSEFRSDDAGFDENHLCEQTRGEDDQGQTRRSCSRFDLPSLTELGTYLRKLPCRTGLEVLLVDNHPAAVVLRNEG